MMHVITLSLPLFLSPSLPLSLSPSLPLSLSPSLPLSLSPSLPLSLSPSLRLSLSPSLPPNYEILSISDPDAIREPRVLLNTSDSKPPDPKKVRLG